jgi:TonB family protein
MLMFPVFSSLTNRVAPSRPNNNIVERYIFPGMPKPKVSAPAKEPSGGGGGGENSAIEARHGGLTVFEWVPKSPPMIVRNANPKLSVEPALIGPPEIPVQITALIGDPLSNANTDSQGPGSDGGFGRSKGGGIGDGDGGGWNKGKKWGYGGGDEPQFAGRNGVGYPECVYCPTPSFSEEARKTKTQGAVTLRIIVGADGRATNLRVMRGLGMGLDERAVEAVRNWRFKPALGPTGKPVPTEVLIEVTFRLL